MEKTSPIIQKTMTEDGWIVTADYGAQGVSRGQVHIAQGTPEEGAKNRRELERVLARFGYRLNAIGD